jgi:ribosomal protein S27AE
LWIILTIIVGGAVMIAYSLVEKRINQRACAECGFTIFVDALPEQCPRCGNIVTRDGGED